ncbi:P-loop containing nucleoside triphosphate hydrolase protein [Meira miltonrushii]|uniref:DNA helicase n=1 Tax=Meira miltonrushii TaxID=1280837 RepID=A0A316VI41_9BASI|nr:P-loop containing nucleoside triphosphate hydrolase protein [Meira miltonrushii]PWN35983.1 P-loop containing nucleoside triphosphate hydrolase protein [Meira miltonrushii]
MSQDGDNVNTSSRSVKLNSVSKPSQNLLQIWIQKHADLLANERKVEQDEARLLLSNCPPKQLERHGLAILGLGVLSISVGLGGKTLIELERPIAFHSSSTFPPHQLRPGDIVQIEDNSIDPTQQGGKSAKGKSTKSKTNDGDANHTADQGLGGVIFRVTDTKIIVAASSKGLDPSDLPARIKVVKVANDSTFDRMEWTLTRLAKILNISVKTAKRSFDAESSDDEEAADQDSVVIPSTATNSGQSSTLVPTLVGQTAPTWRNWPEEEELRLFNENLNASQIEAIKFALTANDFALIHGPPGTGKTTAVAEMVLQLAIVHQKRVLVCGASNLAADNLLERIVSKGGDVLKRSHIGITRIGHPARVLQSLMTATLDYQSQHSSEGGLVKDVRKELESALSSMRPKDTAAGNKSTSYRGQASSKSQKLRGSERKEKREEIKLLRKEFRKRERGLLRAVLQRASIVVSTCHGAGAKQLDGIDFDVVVIDEACQATEATCWTPILKAKQDGQLILAGDHLQLPPTVKGYRHSQFKKHSGNPKRNSEGKEKEEKSAEDSKSGDDDAGSGSGAEEEEQYSSKQVIKRTRLRPPQSLETTLFSRLLGMYGQGCKVLLDTQYRMNEEIMNFPNSALYENKIKAHESCAKIRLADVEGYDIGNSEEEETDNAPIVFYDTAGCEMYESRQSEEDAGSGGKASIFQFDSRANLHEVELVAQHVELLIKNGLAPEKISILSPYNLQVSALADRLRGSKTSKDSKDAIRTAMEKVAIGSVDSMQGMENEVVIISLVRSNEQRNVGFLAEKRRLNVAMTRAKRQLCIVGDSDTIAGAGDEYLKQWMAFLEENAMIEPVIV